MLLGADPYFWFVHELWPFQAMLGMGSEVGTKYAVFGNAEGREEYVDREEPRAPRTSIVDSLRRRSEIADAVALMADVNGADEQGQQNADRGGESGVMCALSNRARRNTLTLVTEGMQFLRRLGDTIFYVMKVLLTEVSFTGIVFLYPSLIVPLM